METIKIIVAFAASFVIAFILYKIFIPYLRRVKLGQKILDIGPKWHKSKEGTPTMGGLFFIISMLLVIAGMYIGGALEGANLFFSINLCFALLNAAIGFVDDYVKLFKKRNKGLTASQKIFFQLIITGGYLVSLKAAGYIDTCINIPFTSKIVDLGFFYYILVGIAIIYIINTANLTDGLDGLAGSVAFVIAALFVIIGIQENDVSMVITEASLGGALAAFLVFNFYPAKVFMGDTGSLFLGSMLVCGVMKLGRPLLMVIIGIIYVIEGLSVMIQVTYFKLTHGKRFFKMSPIHHHFEMCGYSEVKIVAAFLAVTVVACAAAYYIYFNL